MNVLALKGEILEMVSSVQSERLLLRLREAFVQLQQEEETNLKSLLSDEQINELEHAIADSYRDEAIMDISEAKHLHARWLKY